MLHYGRGDEGGARRRLVGQWSICSAAVGLPVALLVVPWFRSSPFVQRVLAADPGFLIPIAGAVVLLNALLVTVACGLALRAMLGGSVVVHGWARW